MNRPRVKDSLCHRCRWAKDKVKSADVDACFCVEYGFIVSHRKDRCKGFEHAKGEDANDGNES